MHEPKHPAKLQPAKLQPGSLLPGNDARSPDVRLPRSRMVVLYLVMLVTAAGNTAMQSVMPSIGTRLQVEDVWVSLAYSWSAVLWMFCAPFWARRSDQRGRKAMMNLGLIGFTVSFVSCGVALWFGLNGYLSSLATLLLFAFGRSFYGVLGCAAPPAVQAYVASRTSRTQRTSALSLVSSSFGLGTVVGPALAPLLILPVLGLSSPFLVFSLIAVAVIIALHFMLPDDDPRYAARGDVMVAPFGPASNPDLPLVHSDIPPAPITTSQRIRWTDPRIRPWLITGLLGGHAQAMLLGLIGFLLLDRLGLRSDPDAAAGPTGLVLMAGAMASLLAQWGLIPLLHLAPRASTLWGLLLAAAGVMIVAVSGDLHGITLGFTVASLGFGLFRPGFTAGASLAVKRAEQGQSAGLIVSINGAAIILAPALGVWLYNHVAWIGFMAIILLCLIAMLQVLHQIAPDEA